MANESIPGAPSSTTADTSSRKIQLVGRLTSEVNRLAAGMKNAETASLALTRNLEKAIKTISSATGGAGFGGGGGGGFFGMGSSGGGIGSGISTAGYFDNSNPHPSSVTNASYAPTGGVKNVGSSSGGSVGGGVADYIGGTMANVTGSVIGMAGPLVKGALAGIFGPMMMGMPNINESIQYQYLANRQAFFTGKGATAGQAMSAQLGYGQGGLPVSPMDPVAASNMAMASGMLPAGAPLSPKGPTNFGQFMGSAGLISMLTPGAGISGGVAGMASLNQARNVNMLRMIGINVRDIGGASVNTFESIVNQLWNVLKTANNGTDPAPGDIAVSAMPGNALASLLDQYFSEPTIRSAVTAALMQKARGGDLTRGSLKGNSFTGALESTSNLYTSLLGAYQGNTDAIVNAVTAANNLGIGLVGLGSKTSKDGVKFGKYTLSGQGLMKTLAFADAFGGIGGGMGGVVLSGLLSGAYGVGTLGGVLSGALGNITGGSAALGLLGLLSDKASSKGGVKSVTDLIGGATNDLKGVINFASGAYNAVTGSNPMGLRRAPSTSGGNTINVYVTGGTPNQANNIANAVNQVLIARSNANT